MNIPVYYAVSHQPHYIVDRWMSSDNNLYESGFWSDGYVLTEALHRFHADVNSLYRKALRTMAYVICYAEEYKLLTDIERSKIPAPKITPEKVELYPDQYYDLYVFYKPFNKVHGLDIIHQLKIYFKTTNNTFDRDTYIVCNNYDESEFCPE